MTLRQAADAIRQAVTALDAADRYGLKHDAHGFAACPFHGDKSPSLKLYAGARGWTCFGCHAGGSVIDLVMRLMDIDFIQAVRKLNLDFSLGLDIGGRFDAHQMRIERDRLKAAAEAREKADAEKNKALDDYLDALKIQMENEQLLTAYAPVRGDDWNERFTEALKKRAEIKNNIEITLDALTGVMDR